MNIHSGRWYILGIQLIQGFRSVKSNAVKFILILYTGIQVNFPGSIIFLRIFKTKLLKNIFPYFIVLKTKMNPFTKEYP